MYKVYPPDRKIPRAERSTQRKGRKVCPVWRKPEPHRDNNGFIRTHSEKLSVFRGVKATTRASVGRRKRCREHRERDRLLPLGGYSRCSAAGMMTPSRMSVRPRSPNRRAAAAGRGARNRRRLTTAQAVGCRDARYQSILPRQELVEPVERKQSCPVAVREHTVIGIQRTPEGQPKFTLHSARANNSPSAAVETPPGCMP